MLLYGEKYGDVPVVVSLAARCNMSAGLVERFGAPALEEAAASGSVDVTGSDGFCFTLTQKSVDERLSLDMRAAARGIPKSVMVVLVHGDADATIPFQDVLELEKEVERSRLLVVAGADHSFKVGVEEIVGCILEEVEAVEPLR